jgi:ABC-type antimicrobial peptide transport system permease subunit
LNLDNPGKIVVYHPLSATATTAHALYLATHVTAGDAMSVLPALRHLAADVNPELRLTDIQTLDEGTSTDVRAWRGFANLILLLSGLALVLSLAGLYAITSFTVSRRTREIAIRAVLGARTPNVVWTVFRGPFVQGAMGVVAGCLMMGGTIALFQRNADVGAATIVKYAAILSGYGTLMMSICGLACIGPLVRILRVEPTDVLRDDG